MRGGGTRRRPARGPTPWLTAQVRAIPAASRGVYGAPRVQAVVRAEGKRVGRKRVARVMCGAGLFGVRRGAARPCATVADPTQAAAPNRVGRDVRAAAPDRLWVGDLTYMPTGEGWRYLPVLLDACSRRVVGRPSCRLPRCGWRSAADRPPVSPIAPTAAANMWRRHPKRSWRARASSPR
jgi:transposase InsO family protein